MKNVLIFPSGSENAIEIYNAISHSVHLNVYGASSKKDQSKLIYDKPILYLPYLDDPNFYNELNRVIVEYDIDYIFPTHDTVAYELAKNEKIVHCNILTSSIETNKICRYKNLTYDLFKDTYFNCKVYDNRHDLPFPIISKPIIGEGAKGIYLITNHLELDLLHDKDKSILVEYLPGDEYTIDCFTNSEGKLLFSKGRKRAEIKMGMSFKSEMVSSELQFEINKIAEIINQRLIFRGLWFFQLKKDHEGNLKLLEVSTRTAGTMAFFRSIGINLPLLTVFNAMGFDVQIKELNLKPVLYRSTKNRIDYGINYNSIYVDYDDTLILKNKVNHQLISFLYRAKNNNKKIYLITRHDGDIIKSLNSYNIAPSLFDHIIHIDNEALKSDYMDSKNAIFIDNWFKERNEVLEKLAIPVFDVDAVEFL